MILPVSKPHKITSPYGPRSLNGKEQFHDGLDFVGKNTNVYAILDGLCIYDMDRYDEALRWIDPKHSAGNLVIIQHTIHNEVYFARYLHLSKNFISQKEWIREGQKIGNYADVGYSFGAHLHFDLYNKSWTKVNPTPFFEGLI